MAEAESYASGNWLVEGGSEDQFISKWSEFLEWTRDNAPGFQGATLIRDASDPRHFLSFARWNDDASQEAWRALPEFREKLGACRQLCEDFQGGSFRRAVSV
jgi:heme-degrading monooxygenase HmoA